MREFTKSMMRFTWSMTVFGTKQMFDLIRSQGRGEKLRETTDAFDQVTHAAESEMEDVTKSVFQFGDSIQKNMVDIMFGMNPFKNSGPDNMEGMVTNMCRQSADTMRKGMNFMQQSASSISQSVQEAGASAGNSGTSSASGWGPMPTSSGSGDSQTQPPPTATGFASSTGVGWGPMPTQSSEPKSKK